MKHFYIHQITFTLLLFSFSMFLIGCASVKEFETTDSVVDKSLTESVLVEQSPKISTTASTAEVSTRDSTPVVLVPSADGSIVYGNSVVTIDASNTKDGYVMVNYTGSNQKPKLQLIGTDENTYTYNLHGGYETFPLTTGDGIYTLVIYENISGNQYSTAFTQSIEVTQLDSFRTYLHPNQYVNYNSHLKTVALAGELAKNASTDLDVVSAVYNYVISNFTYDYDKAANVQSGYLPNVDEILDKKNGICFDYAAVMATMLRVEKIPTRLEVGYRKDVYHAWISIYLEETGWINGIIEFDGTDWKLMDPTFASTSEEPESFTMDLTLYTRKYIY